MSLLGSPREIAVFRALQLGDLLCVVPALRALRNALPRARITLIGLPWARAFVARFTDYLDDFVEFPGFPGLRERAFDAAAFAPWLASVQARRFDLALQLHGDGRLANVLVALLGARRTAGHYRDGDYCPDPERFVRWRAGDHEIERNLKLVRALGIAAPGAALEFPLCRADRRELESLEPLRTLAGRPYACVHAGSQLKSRRWPAERFAAVADALAARGLAVVLTGTAAEAPLAQRVAAAMRRPAIDLTGRTSLGGVAALIDGARLLVANDTGVSHIAAARRTPSVIVACGSDVRRWAPLDSKRHRVLAADVACRPCAHSDCPIGHPCALNVPSGAAIAAADELLGAAVETAACAG